MDKDYVTEVYQPRGTKIQFKIIYQRYNNEKKVILARCHPPHYAPHQLIMIKPEWWLEFYEKIFSFNFKYKEFLKAHPASNYSLADAVEVRNKKTTNILSNFEVKRPFEF